MSDLSPETRALLDAARGGLGPDAAAVKRMRAGVATKVGAGALATVGAKLGLVTLVAVIGVGALVYSQHRETPSQIVAIEAPPIAAPPPVPPATEDLVELEPTAPAVAEPKPVVKPAPKVVADLDREVALIDRATTALASGDTLRAITTIRLYVTETGGHGQLAEEAAAIDVEATCAARLPAAPKKLSAFVAAFPRSAQTARLTAACE